MIQERLPTWPVVMGDVSGASTPHTAMRRPCRVEPRDNRYWFRKGQQDRQETVFFAGIVTGWLIAAVLVGLAWWLQ